MWEHEFICLALYAFIYALLIVEKQFHQHPWKKLGPHKLSGDSGQFHDDVKLAEGEGYELMRTKQNNNRDLCVISGGYTAESIVGQAKVSIRPIQKDL